MTTDGVPVIFIGRQAGFELFDQAAFDIDACLHGDETVDAPTAVGTVGDVITDVGSVFVDGATCICSSPLRRIAEPPCRGAWRSCRDA